MRLVEKRGVADRSVLLSAGHDFVDGLHVADHLLLEAVHKHAALGVLLELQARLGVIAEQVAYLVIPDTQGSGFSKVVRYKKSVDSCTPARPSGLSSCVINYFKK